jgi:drug/metabolite transporter (DMT)-like permease
MNTRRYYLIGFLLLLACDAVVQICFKLAGNHATPMEPNLAWILRLFGHPFVYVSILGYVLNFFIWMSLLKHVPIGPAFAATHLEVVAVMLISIWLFNEPLTLSKGIGAVLIVAGIVCLAFAEDQENPDDPAPVEAKGALGVIAGD